MLFGGPRASKELDIPEASSFHQEYNSMACTIEIVDDVHAAIDNIRQHGSARTDCIVADNHEVAEVFLRQVDSWYALENMIKALQGAHIGTLFHQDAHLWTPVKEVVARDMAVAARESSRQLQALSSQDWKQILWDIPHSLETNEKLIKTENEVDVAAA